MIKSLLGVQLDKLKIYDSLYSLAEACITVNNEPIKRKIPPPGSDPNILS